MAIRIRFAPSQFLRGRLRRWVGLSIAGHVVFLAVAMWTPMLRPKPRLLGDAPIVALVAGPPGAGASAPVPTPPAPEPSDAARIATAEPKPAPLPVQDKPKKPPEKKPPKKAPEKKPAPAPPEPSSSAADSQPSGSPSGSSGAAGPTVGDGAGSVASTGLGGSEFDWYRNALMTALYSHWRRPILDDLSEPIEVLVSFEIQRDGSVRAIEVVQSSGVPSLDRSALRAVYDAAPLPPLPRTWSESTAQVATRFRQEPQEF